MNSAPIKLIKIWLAVLTAWLGLFTIGIVILVALSTNVSPHDPKAMFTRWSGNRLNIGVGGGQFFVTHLKDVNRHSFAELPKPLLIASSGGVLIPHSDLARLTWITPPDVHNSVFPMATNAVVAPPAVGAPIEAIYLFPASGKFRSE